ncbi:MAG: proline dehydrogenase family protein [Actinobacteria bacterium]|nr:proline dehydrogenase family protein [Actinomycetota bacterium]
MAITESDPVQRLVTTTRPGKTLARRFVAGDTLEDAVAAARTLNDSGAAVSFDLLGEEVTNRDSAVVATDEYLDCLRRIEKEGLDANISVKPTQLGLAIDPSLAGESIDRLARAALELDNTVTLDMEDSRYTRATIELFETAQRAHGNLGIAIQAYLRRSPSDLERLVPLGGHIRLCKGAYVEPEEVALTSKSEVDRAFAEQLRVLMRASTTTPAIATHDSALVDLARELAVDRGQAPYEFQMLYGVRPDLQRRLVAEGHRLRVYLPFGSEWYPYLTRRLAERPANAWFFARAMFGH